MGLFYESDKTFAQLMEEKKNFVFIGEAGSGKSEIVLNIAHMLAEKTGRKVDLFDLDQTKPLYRSRDMAEKFASEGVTIHYMEQFQDAPTAVGGVIPSLMGDGYTLLDIGGGHAAARMAGSYSHILSNNDSVPVYIVNAYRPWTKSLEAIDGTMSHILNSIRLDHIYILANPNLGLETSVDEFIQGLQKTDEYFEGLTVINSACVKKDIYEDAKGRTDKALIPIELYLTYEWVD